MGSHPKALCRARHAERADQGRWDRKAALSPNWSTANEDNGIVHRTEQHADRAHPMRSQRRGGRKRIVAPDGSAFVPSSQPQPDGTLVKALARAWRLQRMLDDGIYASVSEIA